MAGEQFDLIVIGGGPGGYAAAIRAAQLGMKTALAEQDTPGGICLNWGCIPTKALLRTAEVLDTVRHAGEHGIRTDGITIDFPAVIRRSRAVARQLADGVSLLLKRNGVQVVPGRGRLAGKGRVTVGERQLSAPHIILATGARARVLPGLEPDGRLVWQYREALLPGAIPGSLLVVGSGAIGVEFASFYHRMGSRVRIIEIQERILPAEDAEISGLVRKSLESQGIRISTGTRVASLARHDAHVTASLLSGDGESSEDFSRVIVAVGVQGNIEDIGLEGTAVRTRDGMIITDPPGRTGEKGVHAIGDVAGPPWLAHKASHEGIACVEDIARAAGIPGVTPHPPDPADIPGCTYCVPEVASVGYTESAAREAGHRIRVGRFPYAGNGKAVALGEPAGLVKLVFDQDSGALLGAHITGAGATEMIQGCCIARRLETTEAELIRTILPHPTLSEMLHEATLDAWGRAIHIPPRGAGKAGAS